MIRSCLIILLAAAAVLPLRAQPAADEPEQDVAPGTIRLKRAPLKAITEVRVRCVFDDKQPRKAYWRRNTVRYKNEYSAWASAPTRPEPLVDSVFSQDRNRWIAYPVNEKVPPKLDFSKYLDRFLQHEYAWRDSVKIDSVLLQIVVNKKGEATLRFRGETENVSEKQANLNRQAFDVFARMKKWHPASMINRRNGEPMNIACTMNITVMIFAKPD